MKLTFPLRKHIIRLLLDDQAKRVIFSGITGKGFIVCGCECLTAIVTKRLNRFYINVAHSDFCAKSLSILLLGKMVRINFIYYVFKERYTQNGLLFFNQTKTGKKLPNIDNFSCFIHLGRIITKSAANHRVVNTLVFLQDEFT